MCVILVLPCGHFISHGGNISKDKEWASFLNKWALICSYVTMLGLGNEAHAILLSLYHSYPSY